MTFRLGSLIRFIVWVSITRPYVFDPSEAPRFPAVLDTGFNESFLIAPRHLREWALLEEFDLPPADSNEVRVYAERVLPRDANL